MATSPRLRAGILVWPLVGFTALGVVGTVMTPALAPHHPLLLISLEARDRNLLLARHIGLAAFLVAGTTRRLVSDPFFYLLGRYHGPAGVEWLERHGGGRAVAATVRAFRRAAYPMLVVFPGAVVCTLAGDAGVPPKIFAAVVIARTIAVVLVIRSAGNVFSGPIDSVLHAFDHHVVAASLLCLAAVAGWMVWEHRRRAPAGRG
jgi:membrane protein DedA with SNARE-associated domain